MGKKILSIITAIAMLASFIPGLFVLAEENVEEPFVVIEALAEPESEPPREPQPEDVVSVASSEYHTMAIRADGSLWAWGDNSCGQFGNGTKESSSIPIKIEFDDVKKIVMAGKTTFAIKNDGSLYSCGASGYGKYLGDGSVVDRAEFARIMDRVEDMSVNIYKENSSEYVVFAVVREDGSVYTWGRNNYGQLGDGTTTDSTYPKKVGGLPEIKRVFAIGYNVFAVDTDGFVWGWGKNDYHQLGNNESGNITSPVKIDGIKNIRAMSTAIATIIYALDDDNALWGWGTGYHSGLSYASSDLGLSYEGGFPSATPQKRLEGIKDISKDISDLSILDLNGNVYSWKDNQYNPQRAQKVEEHDPSTFITGFPIGFAIKKDGTLWAKGSDLYGELGIGCIPGSYRSVNDYVEVIFEKDEHYDASMIEPKPLAAGENHSLAIRSDGNVWAWGSNMFGQLGNGTNTDAPLPVKIDLDGKRAVAVSAYGYSSAAITEDGALYTWGENSNYQLGTENNINSNVPIKVLERVRSVSMGANYTIASDFDGRVWVWGSNSNFIGCSWKQKMLTNIVNVSAVSAGKNNSVVIAGGSLSGWGSYLGSYVQNWAYNSSTKCYDTPARLGMAGVKAIASGDTHTLALSEDGTVYSLGYGDKGQLGVSSTTSASANAWGPMYLNVKAKAIAAGADRSFIISEDGELWACGYNGGSSGYLGLSGSVNVTVPQKTSYKNVTAVSTGGSHTLIISDGIIHELGGNGVVIPVDTAPLALEGTVTIEGGSIPHLKAGDTLKANTTKITVSYGTVGTLTCQWLRDGRAIEGATESTYTITGDDSYAMISVRVTSDTCSGAITSEAKGPVKKFVGVKAVSVGSNHTAAITEDGDLYTWGSNTAGQLGIGYASDSQILTTRVLTNVKSVAAGNGHTLAVTEDGTLWAWGLNDYGQLGDGTTQNTTRPKRITSISNVKAVYAEMDHSAAITEDGDLYMWGWNLSGQLGVGTQGADEIVTTPTFVTNNVTKVDLSFTHTLIIKNGYDLWGCGLGAAFTGSSTVEYITTPKRIIGAIEGYQITDIAAGLGYSTFVTEFLSSSLYVQGVNDSGQLGLGNTLSSYQRTKVTSMSDAKYVSAGRNSTAVITKSGQLYMFGNNEYGKLGVGYTGGYATRPTSVLGDVMYVDAGHYHSAAILNNGTLLTWGRNDSGQLGDGTYNDSNVPVEVDFYSELPRQYEVENISPEDGVITSLKVVATDDGMDVIATSEDDIDAVMYVVYYKNGQITNVYSAKFEEGVATAKDTDYSGYDTRRVMIWTTKMNPIISPVTLY